MAEPSPQHDDLVAPGLDGFDALADQRGDDVGGFGVEVVARAVEVDGEEVDGVDAVLVAVGLALDQEHFLGDAVGGVGLLGVAVPEVVFPEGDGGELGVGADGAEDDISRA